MKYLVFVIFISVILFSCGSDDDVNPNCNFLFDVSVNTSVNISLPQFNQLQFPANSVFIPNAGNQGIIVTNTGSGFFAWDASDPNHNLQSCSILSITGGIEATCGCEDANTYSLINGQSLDEALPCTLINYRVENQGGTLFISN